jgi:hypothetical protein
MPPILPPRRSREQDSLDAPRVGIECSVDAGVSRQQALGGLRQVPEMPERSIEDVEESLLAIVRRIG